MIRNSLTSACFALFAGLALSACGSDTPTSEETERAAQDIQKDIKKVPDLFDQYLPWDANADGVKTTDSGLQYIIIKKGPDGGKSPTSVRDKATVMYDGRLAEGGAKFDSSYDRGSPASFQLNQVIPGWTEGLQLMSEGDEFLFYIPSEIGYGQNPRPGGLIKPGDDLVFRVELQSLQMAPPPKLVDAEAWAKYVPWDDSNDGVVKRDSGMQYVVLASGPEDGVSPEGGDNVVVFYEGRLNETGEMFDSAFERGEPALFPANRLIPGWVEALGLMKPGDRWLVFVPSKLAYGVQGTPGGPIPPNSDLVFEVEVMDVLKLQ